MHGVLYDGNETKFILVLSAELSGVFDLVHDGTTLKSTAALVITQTNENKRHAWSTARPFWTGGQKVALAIREYVDFQPTGQVTIDGTFAENEVLTANTSAIEDANGLTGVSYSYQWGALQLHGLRQRRRHQRRDGKHPHADRDRRDLRAQRQGHLPRRRGL